MGSDKVSRRRFMGQASLGIGSAVMAANWPAILAAQQHAHQAAQSGTPVKFDFFTSDQGREVEAVAAQIIPSDATPGAREAGVIYFIDRALSTFDSDKQKQYVEGLEQLKAKLKELYPDVERFSQATAEQQVAVLKAIEKSEFFALVRTHTVMGFFCLPERGGNREQAGWKLIGFEDAHVFTPPFGYYDRDYPGWEAGNSNKVKE